LQGKPIVSTILNVAGTLALTGLGWIIFEFIGRPVRNFFDLRRETKRLMMLYWDLPSTYLVTDRIFGIQDQWTAARSEFSDIGARLVSFDAAESLAAWFVRLMRFDPRKAGAALLVIANEFGSVDEERDKNYSLVEHALKFREK
jgi:hypothetical protein